MINFDSRCTRSVDTQVTCCKCAGNVVKYGWSSQNKQRYYCKSCKITQVENYSYMAYLPAINLNIISLTKEGCGIRSAARLLKISATTVISRIKKIASKIVQPPILTGKTYQVDELRTFVRKKRQFNLGGFSL